MTLHTELSRNPRILVRKIYGRADGRITATITFDPTDRGDGLLISEQIASDDGRRPEDISNTVQFFLAMLRGRELLLGEDDGE